MPAMKTRHVVRSARTLGFSLVELMVALTLGLLIALGLVTLFEATSKTNRVQEGMAEMQENGRYAVTRVNYDLRLASRQLMNASGYSAPTSPNTSVLQAPNVYYSKIPFPDGDLLPPAGWPALTTVPTWPLSPAFFIAGNACSASACSPTAVPGYLPAMGTGVGSRVQNSDVLTVRYLNSPGYSSYQGGTPGTIPELKMNCSGTSLTNLVWTKITNTKGGGLYKSADSNFASDDLAMLTDSSGNSSIFQVDVAGAVNSTQTLTPKNINGPPGTNVKCLEQSGEIKLFNFSRDFVTVHYWLRLDADQSVAGRVIPALMRTQANNTGAASVNHVELVQGVEQMTFLFGVQKLDGNVQYLDAGSVATGTNCPLPPGQFTKAAVPDTTACLWRSLASVEVHMLVDSINNLYTLTPAEMMYRYNGSTPINPPAQNIAMPNGVNAGMMMRREFMTLVSIRNYNT